MKRVMLKSPCRICGLVNVLNLEGVFHHKQPWNVLEECIPSDNLEYLEWQYNKRSQTC